MCSASASLNRTRAISWRPTAPLEHRQQLAVVRRSPRRARTSCRARSPATRQVPDRLVLVLRAEPVVREQTGAPRRSLPAVRCSSHSAARRCSRSRSSCDERPVGGLLDQRMLEAVLGLGPPAPLAHEIEPHQLGRARRRRLPAPCTDRLEQRLRGTDRPSTEAAASTALLASGPRRSIRARITFSTVGRDLRAATVVVEPPPRRRRGRARPRRPASATSLLEEERIPFGRLARIRSLHARPSAVGPAPASC